MKKIAILGASYLQKPLVEKAIEMGLETHCFAWDNTEAICKSIAHFFYPISVLEKDEILNKCMEIHIDANAIIKANTVLNIGCTISHNSTIESHCFLAPRVTVAGFVNVSEQCFLGINSTVIDSISIIEKTRIGGASVVVKSIEKSGLYAGNPAKFLKL